MISVELENKVDNELGKRRRKQVRKDRRVGVMKRVTNIHKVMDIRLLSLSHFV